MVAGLAVGLSSCQLEAKPITLPPGVHPAAIVDLIGVHFVPADVTIHAGQTVEWKWTQNLSHNITFASFHSPLLHSGIWYHTFSTPGVYPYVCTIHRLAGMYGKVTVLG